jgi:hypothetical protein
MVHWLAHPWYYFLFYVWLQEKQISYCSTTVTDQQKDKYLFSPLLLADYCNFAKMRETNPHWLLFN